MKKLAIFLFCAVPFLARAITTTLEYEDRREADGRAAISNEIAQAVAPLASTNDLAAVVTNLQAQIENAAPADYEIVSNKAMTALQEHQSLTNYYTKGQVDSATDEVAQTLTAEISSATNSVLSQTKPRQSAKASPAAEAAEAYQFIDTITQDADGVIAATKKTMRKATTSAPGMVQLNDNTNSTRTDHAATANAVRRVAEDVASAIAQIAQKAGLSDLANYVPITRKVNNKALSSDITLSASDVGAATPAALAAATNATTTTLTAELSSATNTVFEQVYTKDEVDNAIAGATPSDYDTVKAQVTANTSAIADKASVSDVYRIVAGTNVVLVVTNYNSEVHAPLLSLQHLDTETGEYVTYWSEERRHGITLTNAMEYADAGDTAERARADAAYAPRGWSAVTSGLGAEAPDGVTWISTPETVIAGGYEWEKVVTTSGACWFLASNGMTAGALTNGYFSISATDGTEIFSIEKTDSYLVGIDPDAITRSGNTCTITIAVDAQQHPYIRACTNLINAVWVEEDENGFACDFASVAWSGTSGAYVATVTCAEPAAFFYFEFLHEGSTKVKCSAKMEVSGGLYYNGTTYYPVVSGNELKFIAP